MIYDVDALLEDLHNTGYHPYDIHVKEKICDAALVIALTAALLHLEAQKKFFELDYVAEQDIVEYIQSGYDVEPERIYKNLWGMARMGLIDNRGYVGRTHEEYRCLFKTDFQHCSDGGHQIKEPLLLQNAL